MSASDAGQVAGGRRPGAGALRVSDADREAVAHRLLEAHGEGRLTLAEFDERVGAAHGAVVRADLDPLLADLPLSPTAGGALRAEPARSAEAAAAADVAGPAESSGPGRRDRHARPGPRGLAPFGPVPFGPVSFGPVSFGPTAFPVPVPIVGPCAGHGLRAAVATWAVASAVNLMIWVAVVAGTGHLVHPWWVWVAGPWGVVLLSRLGGRRESSRAPS